MQEHVSHSPMQRVMFDEQRAFTIEPFQRSLLKWVGNKQRVAHEIAAHFPKEFRVYHEPFIGSGAVLGTLAPEQANGSDAFGPLVGIWQNLHRSPETLKRWYADRWRMMHEGNRTLQYERIKASYNANPNPADLLFLCRSCYGGVVRFRQADGYMSTPVGVHNPMPPESFDKRVDEWRKRTKGTQFALLGYEEAMERAKSGDLIYCDPPYSNSQGILYGAQSFDLRHLFAVIERCVARGVFVALSIDGTKRSGKFEVQLPIPKGLFKKEVFIHCGRSMLKRFQMNGKSLESESVSDRLLLTY